MTVKGIQSALAKAKLDGKVEPQEVDEIALEARSGWGMDRAERAALAKMADGFSDASKQRMLTHLAAMGQKNAWVNLQVGQLASIKGRYAEYTIGVPGLSAKLGLFDNCFSLKGQATADGLMRVAIEGEALSVPVKAGETAAEVLGRVHAMLPAAMSGVLLAGDVQPFDPAAFAGPAPQETDVAAHLMLYKPAALKLKPGEVPMRVVVTGYGAFLGITDNASAKMAQKLAEHGVAGGIVEYRRLDVTVDAVDAFLDEMRRSPPDVILSMGVDWRSQVEERPENHLGSGRDGNDQPLQPRRIDPNAPDELPTDLPVDAIETAVAKLGSRREVGTSIEDRSYTPDRTSYLCNYLGFSLANAFLNKPTTAGFVHIRAESQTEPLRALLNAIAARQLEVRRAPAGRT